MKMRLVTELRGFFVYSNIPVEEISGTLVRFEDGSWFDASNARRVIINDGIIRPLTARLGDDVDLDKHFGLPGESKQIISSDRGMTVSRIVIGADGGLQRAADHQAGVFDGS